MSPLVNSRWLLRNDRFARSWLIVRHIAYEFMPDHRSAGSLSLLRIDHTQQIACVRLPRTQLQRRERLLRCIVEHSKALVDEG